MNWNALSWKVSLQSLIQKQLKRMKNFYYLGYLKNQPSFLTTEWNGCYRYFIGNNIIYLDNDRSIEAITIFNRRALVELFSRLLSLFSIILWYCVPTYLQFSELNEMLCVKITEPCFEETQLSFLSDILDTHTWYSTMIFITFIVLVMYYNWCCHWACGRGGGTF